MADTGDLPTKRAFTPVMPVFTLGETGAKEKLLFHRVGSKQPHILMLGIHTLAD